MTTATKLEVYRPGATIVRQGSTGDSMYLVRSGKVRIYRTHEGTQTTLGTIGPGEVFGEMAVFVHKPRSASAEAITDTELREITQEEFIAMDCDPVIRQVLNNMAERLHDVDEGYERLAVDAAKRREFMSTMSVRREWAGL